MGKCIPGIAELCGASAILVKPCGVLVYCLVKLCRMLEIYAEALYHAGGTCGRDIWSTGGPTAAVWSTGGPGEAAWSTGITGIEYWRARLSHVEY